MNKTHIHFKYGLISLVITLTIGCASQPSSPQPETSPQQINTLISNSLAYASRGKLTLAETNIQQALAIDADNIDANNIAGLIYAKSNRPALATKHFQKALAQAPNDASTLNNYGNFLCDSGNMHQAEQVFLRAATHSSNPNPEIAYTNAGLCILRVPDVDQAENYFKTALDFKENNSIALFHLAQINVSKNRGVPALERLRAYARYAQHTPKTLKLGIEIGRLLKDKKTEVSYFNLLQSNFPNSEEYQWAIASMK